MFVFWFLMAFFCYRMALGVYRDARRHGYEHTPLDDMPMAARMYFGYGALCLAAAAAFFGLGAWDVVVWLLAA